MAIIETTVEIDRPPAEVRAIILDWENLSTWHTTFLKSIKPLPAGTPPSSLKKGDTMLLKFLASPEMKCKIYQNDEECLAWEGGPGLLFHGIHSFKLEALDGGSRTRLRHGEKFTGIIGEGVALPGIKGMVRGWYEGYNRDLKKKCEGEVAKA